MQKLFLYRTYYPTATNGRFVYEDKEICKSIELVWNANKNKISCISEGTYEIVEYNSPTKGIVLLLKNVPKRDMIEIHKANYAIPYLDTKKRWQNPQLLGCIAPVTSLDQKAGVGWDSKKAFDKLMSILLPILRAGNEVSITITKDNHGVV